MRDTIVIDNKHDILVLKGRKQVMETNGPANIVMYLDMMFDDHKISYEDYKALREMAMKTVDYMRAYSRNNKIQWHEIDRKVG